MSVLKKIETLPSLVEDLLKDADVFLRINSRIGSSKELGKFHTFDSQKLEKLAEMMPEIDRGTRSFAKSNSQTTSRLLSLTMLNVPDSPYRLLRQCLAQIEKKRAALRENIFKLKEDYVRILELRDRYDNEENPYRKERLNIKIERTMAKIADSTAYIEAALKEIGTYQEAYNEIRESYNIDKWDEEDFEKAEVDFLVRLAYRNLIRDMIAHRSPGMGTLELLEQVGINAVAALEEVNDYIDAMEKKKWKDSKPDFEDLASFLNEMAQKHGEDYKKALKHSGLRNSYLPDYCYKEEQ